VDRRWADVGLAVCDGRGHQDLPRRLPRSTFSNRRSCRTSNNDAQMGETPEPGDFNSWSALRARDWTTQGSGKRSHATPVEKKCSRCEETKPASEFWRVRASPDGLNRWCRQCDAADQSSKNYPASDTGTIVCVQCHIEKSVLEFPANRRLRTGRSTLCKTCTKGRWLRLYRSSLQATSTGDSSSTPVPFLNQLGTRAFLNSMAKGIRWTS
jgi:hypothetical protein